jgi:hypothetical protein
MTMSSRLTITHSSRFTPLTSEQEQLIRTMTSQGYSQREIALRTGASPTSVSKRQKKWKPDPLDRFPIARDLYERSVPIRDAAQALEDCGFADLAAAARARALPEGSPTEAELLALFTWVKGGRRS